MSNRTASVPARRGSADMTASAAAGSAPSRILGRYLHEPLRRQLRQAEALDDQLRSFVRGVPYEDEKIALDAIFRFLPDLQAERDALPPQSQREALRTSLREAVEANANGAAVGEILGALFDGVATFDPMRSPGAIDAYAMVLEMDLEERPAPPAALAMAAVETIRAERFIPPPGVFLERVRAAERRISAAVRLLDEVNHAIARLGQIEAASTPEARAARQAERQAARERRIAMDKELAAEFPHWFEPRPA
jgi:hypothetical protein